MTGAELLALARHNRGAGETDAQTAQRLAAALRLLLLQLTDGQCTEVRNVLQQIVNEDMIRRGVRNDYYTDMQAHTNS